MPRDRPAVAVLPLTNVSGDAEQDYSPAAPPRTSSPSCREDIAAARPLFQRAIELDPSFGRAHTSLAYTHQLDESDSYGHIMMAFAHRWAGETELTLAAARRGVEVNPNDASAEASPGNALDLIGQPSEARLHLERALRLNPRDPHAKFFPALMARTCLSDRDDEAAEVWARKAIELDSGRPDLTLQSGWHLHRWSRRPGNSRSRGRMFVQ